MVRTLDPPCVGHLRLLEGRRGLGLFHALQSKQYARVRTRKIAVGPQTVARIHAYTAYASAYTRLRNSTNAYA